MRCDPLSARRALIVAPHPDDEAIGTWGLIRSLRRSGARVDILVVSDGGASHPGSRCWPPARLVRARRRETVRAMRTLGLAPSAIRFLALPDGALSEQPDHVRGALAKAMRQRPWPDLIVGPERADDHADHRAVAAALSVLRRRGEMRLGYHVWPIGAGRGPRRCNILLDGCKRAMKRRIVRSYRTQTGIVVDAAAGFAMTHRHLRAFVGPREAFAVLA